ncbi:DUF305 domain-containing protein [Nocardioides astragali]|uniref:DUF305 domain-containing protein n=1 Tax=Nocardioides astragali TaxID=1776736 RepID=A0ABW2N8K3_9ACTN|nr:DUF305 domain-containing protein [Nocardioides astragali]
MNRTWKIVALTSSLWGALLVVVVMLVAPPVLDWRSDGWTSDHSRGLVHMRGDDMHGDSGNGMWATSEYAYLAEMVPHHLEAIAAAQELRRSERPEVRQLGEDIVASQRAQVRLMEGWLDRWYPDRPARDPGYQPMMRDLSGLDGDALDRAFLTDMVRHHMMAIMSSQHLLLSGDVEHPEVADLAAAIRDEQREEIVLMRRLLTGDQAPGLRICPTR